MASGSANEVAKAINSFNRHSTNDQRLLLAVMEDYFTSTEDPDEDQLLENEAGKLCKGAVAHGDYFF